MMLRLHVIQFPSGQFGFVGGVPGVLLYEFRDGGGMPTDEEVTMDLMRPCGARLLKTRTWPTRGAAEEEARTLGYEVIEVVERTAAQKIWQALHAIEQLRRSDGWRSRFEGCASGDGSEWAGATLHDCEDALRAVLKEMKEGEA